jgi:hypothetical protein
VSFGRVSFSAESHFKAFGGSSVSAETDFTVSAGAETVFTTRRKVKCPNVSILRKNDTGFQMGFAPSCKSVDSR